MALRAASPSPEHRRDTPEGGILIETDNPDRRAAPPPVAPRIEDRPANATPEFVD
jgi:hypothetical protein